MTTQYKTVEIQVPPLCNIYSFYSTFLKKFLARWSKMEHFSAATEISGSHDHVCNLFELRDLLCESNPMISL